MEIAHCARFYMNCSHFKRLLRDFIRVIFGEGQISYSSSSVAIWNLLLRWHIMGVITSLVNSSSVVRFTWTIWEIESSSCRIGSDCLQYAVDVMDQHGRYRIKGVRSELNPLLNEFVYEHCSWRWDSFVTSLLAKRMKSKERLIQARYVPVNYNCPMGSFHKWNNIDFIALQVFKRSRR